MASAASLMERRGVALYFGLGTDFALADMEILLSSSALRFDLNSWCGRLRKSIAIFTRGAISAATDGGAPSRRARSASTTKSNCEICLRSVIRFTQARPQSLNGAELQLLNGPFAAAQFARNFANAALFGEAHLEDAALIFRKLRDQAEQGSATFNGFKISSVCSLRFRRLRPSLSRCPLLAVQYCIRCNSEEPCRERDAAPFEFAEVCQRMMKNLGGYVPCRIAVVDAGGDK